MGTWINWSGLQSWVVQSAHARVHLETAQDSETEIIIIIMITIIINIYWVSTISTWINSFNPHNNPERVVSLLLPPLYKKEGTAVQRA